MTFETTLQIKIWQLIKKTLVIAMQNNRKIIARHLQSEHLKKKLLILSNSVSGNIHPMRGLNVWSDPYYFANNSTFVDEANFPG